MRRPARGHFWLHTLPAAALATALAVPAATAQQWPPEIKNLQHFAADTEVGELIGTMRDFAFALGVRCQYCHVGEEGQPIATFDFASDQKETKRKARIMLSMVERINGELLAGLDVEPAGRLRVECVTCHRGAARPEQLADILVRVASEEGGEAAVARYRELREEHLEGQAYDFGESTLMRAAERLARSDRLDAAAELLGLDLELNPGSSWALMTLAAVEERRGELAAAIAALEQLEAANPGNPQIGQKLEELRRRRAEQPPE